MAVPENDGRVTDTVQHPLIVLARLRRKAVDVRERRPVTVEDPVELDLRLQRVEPSLVGAVPRLPLAERRDDLRPVERRFTRPPLAVAADQSRVRKGTQALDALLRVRTPRTEIAAEQ